MTSLQQNYTHDIKEKEISVNLIVRGKYTLKIPGNHQTLDQIQNISLY